MVNATELRIGNYILDEKGRIKRAWLIKQNSIQTSDYDINESEIDPIPLTPDILIACGFKRDTIHGTFWLDGVRINDDGKPFYLINTLKTKIIGIEIKYLHQLQNLYFALTGKYLEVKL